MDYPTEARIHHATKAKAERLEAMLAAEYPALTLTCIEDDDGVAFEVTHGHGDEMQSIYVGAKAPELADLLETCEENELDPEEMGEGAADEEEELQSSGSVVGEGYRARYQEVSSNGQTCGDWLAEELVTMTHSIEGFNVADFTAVLEANGVDFSGKWASLPESGQKGWIGRYRMNGRQVLEKMVAWNGVLRTATRSEVIPPAEVLEALRTKHAKWIAKETKRYTEAAKIEAARRADAVAAIQAA